MGILGGKVHQTQVLTLRRPHGRNIPGILRGDKEAAVAVRQ